MRKQLLCVATGIVLMSWTAPSADAGGFLKKLFGCKKDECCEPAPACCEAEPEPVCCPEPEPICCPEPEPAPVCCPEPEPEPVCCPEPEPEPEPVCCEPAPEPASECCEPAPEPAPCCASHPILEGLPEGSKIVSMRIIPRINRAVESETMIASEFAPPAVVLGEIASVQR